MKLSANQQFVLAYAVFQIQEAKSCPDFETWFVTVDRGYYKDYDIKKYEWLKKHYNDRKNNTALSQTSTNTLRALEKRGLIEILHDGKSCVDHIKVTQQGLDFCGIVKEVRVLDKGGCYYDYTINN